MLAVIPLQTWSTHMVVILGRNIAVPSEQDLPIRTNKRRTPKTRNQAHSVHRGSYPYTSIALSRRIAGTALYHSILSLSNILL